MARFQATTTSIPHCVGYGWISHSAISMPSLRCLSTPSFSPRPCSWTHRSSISEGFLRPPPDGWAHAPTSHPARPRNQPLEDSDLVSNPWELWRLSVQRTRGLLVTPRTHEVWWRKLDLNQ